MNENGLYPNCKELTYEIIEEKLNPEIEKRGWGFSMADCLYMIADHMTRGTLAQEAVEYMLTDCNYHELCGHLHNGNYDYALNWVYNDYVVRG